MQAGQGSAWISARPTRRPRRLQPGVDQPAEVRRRERPVLDRRLQTVCRHDDRRHGNHRGVRRLPDAEDRQEQLRPASPRLGLRPGSRPLRRLAGLRQEDRSISINRPSCSTAR